MSSSFGPTRASYTRLRRTVLQPRLPRVPQDTVSLTTEDDLRLEARLLLPPDPVGAVVICHPHPLMNGSMSSSLIPVIQRRCGAAGLAALRFNFRGVRRSEGRFEGGLGEQRDVRAALEALRGRFPALPLAVAGWSFGSLVGLAASAGTDVRRVALVAPPVSVDAPERLPDPPAPERLADWDASVLAICGTLDPYSRPTDVQVWGEKILGDRFRVEVIDGADHRFAGQESDMADLVATHITPP